MNSRTQRALDVLEVLNEHDVCSRDENYKDWTLSGTRALSLVLRLLGDNGAITSDVEVGRYGKSIHSITPKGKMLLNYLRHDAISNPEQWGNPEVLKWWLILKSVKGTGKGYRDTISEDEIIGLSYAWKGSDQHRAVLMEFGGMEVKKVLEATQALPPATIDIPFIGSPDDIEGGLLRALEGLLCVDNRYLTRIALLVLYRVLAESVHVEA
jgi:hypothetical protein